MAAFNAELAAKALERRVQGLESQLDVVNKQGRVGGDSVAAVNELKKLLFDQKQRMEALEKIVKALMETRGDSKQAALGKLEQTVRDLELKQVRDRDEMIAKLDRESAERAKPGIGEVVRKQDVTKLIDEQILRTDKALRIVVEAESRRHAVEAERKVQADIAEMQRRHEAEIEQRIKGAQRTMQEAAERSLKAMVEVQIATLTARLNVVEGRMKQ